MIEEVSQELGTPLTSITNNLFLMEARLQHVAVGTPERELVEILTALQRDALAEAERATRALGTLRQQYRALVALAQEGP